MLEITALYAALLTFILLWLAARVIIYRRKNRISLGDNGNNSLLKRMRAHSNFVEYAPFGVVLLALVELQGSPAFVVHGLGLMLLVGRGLHAYGFSASPPSMRLRVGGTLLTLTMLLLSAIGLLAHSLF
ncbi:MAPEG family protein [Algirhabdus cladophorae]|uniref:MAPEG family protein n=1 Tax=Algirhabdus cladophorae TaxID=3377108 RepID=UPI003B848B35